MARIILGSSDSQLTTPLGAQIEAYFEDVEIVVEDSVTRLETLSQHADTECLILDASEDDSAENVIVELQSDDSTVPIILLTDTPSDYGSLPVGAANIVDIRSREEAIEHPEFVVSSLERLRAQPGVTGNGLLEPGMLRLFDEHALPMLLIEPDTGVIVAANDAAIAFYKYSREELTAMTVQEIHELDAAEVAARRREAANSEGTTFVFQHRLKTGELRTVEVHSTPITHRGQTLLFSIIQDITARKHAEEALTVAHNRFHRLTEQNIVGIYTIHDGRFTYVNPKMAETFGTTPTEMIGDSIYDYVAPGDRDEVRQNIQERVAGTVETSHYTFSGVHPEKDRLIVEVHGGRVETDGGVVIIGTMLDITERDAHERELRRFSSAVEALAQAVYITDAEGTILSVNPAFEAITGYSEREALGETPRILNSGRMADSYYQRLYRTLAEGEIWDETIINQRKTGEVYHASQTIAPYLDSEGTIEGFVAIQVDITKTRILEQVLDVFQRIFRHNLRNELNVIRGYANLIEEDLTGTPFHEYTSVIKEAAAELQALSDKASIVEEATETGAVASSVKLRGVLDREIEQLKASYPEVVVDVMVPDSVWVVGDGRLDVAIHEVLANSVEHCDRRPEIAISADVDDERSMVVLQICDNGPGVDSVELETFSIDAESDVVHSAGIGMWLVKWAVTSLGGEVTISNSEPQGLTVTFTLPLAPPE